MFATHQIDEFYRFECTKDMITTNNALNYRFEFNYLSQIINFQWGTCCCYENLKYTAELSN